MTKRALVMGGGGTLGVAWETGLLAGLESEGVSLANADFILGTSAGSIVGSTIARGVSPHMMAEMQIAAARQAAGSPAAAGPAPDLSKVMAFFMRMPETGEPPVELRREIGEVSRTSATMSEDAMLAQFAAIGVTGSWPRNFACTAVDAVSGEFHVWRENDKVDFAHAIASSCSVPGIYPAISINGRQWMDGGMRSGTNVDVAAGHERVLAVVVIPMALANERMKGRVNAEAAAVTKAGGRFAMIAPDAETQEAFGPNLMDGSRRIQLIEQGLRQGKAEAARIKAFWN
ncbi:MAG: patatin-like phospholipase family protein [Hyphomonadaceae bacterium]